MHLLTWHGTIVRTDRASGAWIHAPLWPARAISDDLDMPLPAGIPATPITLPGDPPMQVLPEPHGQGIRFRRSGLFLCAEPRRGAVIFDRPAPGPWETFLPVDAEAVAALRDIMAHGWTIAETDEVVPASAISLGEGFILEVGYVRVALRTEIPAVDGPDGRLAVATNGQVVRLQRGMPSAVREIRLAPREPIGNAIDGATLAACGLGSVMLEGEPEHRFLPLTVHRADQDWMYARLAAPDPFLVGPAECKAPIFRAPDQYVLAPPWGRVAIFGADGASSGAGILRPFEVAERGAIAWEGDTVFADLTKLAQAPTLSGTFVVLPGLDHAGEDGMLFSTLLPLAVLRPFLAANARLLIPRQAVEATRPLLEAWGFGDMEIVAAPELCRVADALWLGTSTLKQVPASYIAAARDRLRARLGTPGTARLIFARPREGLANPVVVQRLLEQSDFETAHLESLPLSQQLEVFRDAAFVVAADAAALRHLMACAPGTKVLQLMPARAYQPDFATLSAKLGLIHAVLPADDPGTGAGMAVNLASLRSLLRLLQASE